MQSLLLIQTKVGGTTVPPQKITDIVQGPGCADEHRCALPNRHCSGATGAAVPLLHAASAHIRTAVTHRIIDFPSITDPALAQNGRRDYST